jgi:hypothetical protein
LKYYLSVLAILLFGLLPLSALTTSTSAQQGAGQGLEISPPLVDIKADPGQVIKTQLKVRNVTKETLVVEAEYNDFVASGEDGSPKILLKDEEQSPYSIKDWLSTIPTATLAPRQQQTFDVTITVPKDASPGGHYGVVRYTGTPADAQGSGVSLSASIGTLMLVRVSGDVQESAKITELFSSRDGKKRTLFEYGPIGIVTKIENTGNVHIKPKGTIRVSNMFGKTVQDSQLNSSGGNVLPKSTRKFSQQLNKKLLFGKYKIQADVTYGEENKIISQTASFWVIPYKLVAISLALLALLIFLVTRYNKFIVKRSKKKQGNGHTKKED